MPSGEAETNPYLLGETDPAPPGSGEAESIPQPSGETEPALKASGETETSPGPSGETEPTQRRRARWNQAPVIPVRGEATLLCVQKFLTYGGYWFHLLGYPGIRSPTVVLVIIGL